MKMEGLKTCKNNLFIGPFILEPKVFLDQRGYFYESWNKKKFFQDLKKEVDFVQENTSLSLKGVLRGLHYQLEPKAQDKLIKCVKGKIFDVVVDLRKNSPNFGLWGGIEISEKNKKQLWVPKGFAHGFLTLSKVAIVEYKITNFWDTNSERSIYWKDKTINIDWPLKEINSSKIIVSEKDNSAPSFKEAIAKLDIYK